jgi:transcriptional regulator with XRE-family HTH domain
MQHPAGNAVSGFVQRGCETEECMKELDRELDYRKMGMRIRQVRKTRGWSQDALAKKCGISMSFLGHIERGTRIMSLETFVNICMALEADADELLWGVPHPSDAVLELWDASDQKQRQKQKKIKNTEKQSDSYSMYVRIMKSVAEIMNEA